jgi:putative membrane protein
MPSAVVALSAFGLLLTGPAAARAFPAGRSAAAVADPGRQADAPKPDPTDPYDADFLYQVAASGMADVAYSELADARAGDDEVKAFARRVAKDNGLMNDTMAQAAAALKLPQPSKLDREASRTAYRLSFLKGAEFDRAYMKQMVEDHEKAARLFEKEAKDGNNDNVRDLAADSLPAVQDRLKQARTLSDKLKG